MRYYLIVGEASGDLHASNLMSALKSKDKDAEFRFYGGDKMKAVGGTLVKHYKEMAYMGFIPVMMHLRTILRNMSLCKKDIMLWNPDVVILVDYPGFNLDIAKFLKQNSKIPVFYYISPKIWAWKEYRIKNIRNDVDRLFSILPFEIDYFTKRHGYKEVTYVGNPCVDAIDAFLKSDEGKEKFSDFCKTNGIEEKPIIAILAGSRKQEIKDNLEKMVRAASEFKDYQIVIAGAPGLDADYYQKFIPKDVNVSLVFGQTYRLLRQSVAALVTSGTATLETAILRVPQVVCYYIACGKFVSFLRRMLLKVPYISLVNLVIGKKIVEELVADGMTVTNIKINLEKILPGGDERKKMLADYDEMLEILGEAGASERAAEEMLRFLS